MTAINVAFRGRLKDAGVFEDAQRIAERHGVSLEKMLTPGKAHTDQQAKASKARVLFVLSLRGIAWSWPQIGKLLGLDHTTCMAFAIGKPVRCAERGLTREGQRVA